MYTLVSKWNLARGIKADALPPALQQALEAAAATYTDNEPGTLMYLANVAQKNPFDEKAPPPNQIVFIEGYADQAAFEAHVNGSWYQDFVSQNIEYFEQKDGQPVTDTVFVSRLSGSLHIDL